jgi:hypothetical protein
MTEAAGIAQFDETPPARRTPSPLPNGGVLRRAALVALILGSVLTVTNQSGAVFGSENIQLLPFLLVYLTPFVVVTISQLLGARQAVADVGRGKVRGTAAESFASTAFAHSIPRRAALVGLLVAGVNIGIVVIVALLERGSLDELPLALLGQAFALPVLFGVLSQAVAYRRAALTQEGHGGSGSPTASP